MNTFRSIVLHGVTASIGSSLLGLPFCGSRVFDYHHHDFQLVLLGLCVGMLLEAVRSVTFPKYVVVTALVWVGHALAVRSGTWPYLVRDAAYVLCLSTAIFVSQLILSRTGWGSSLMKRSLVRVGAVLVGYLLAAVSLSFAWQVDHLVARTGEFGQMGLLLATGSVLGVEFGEAVIGRRRMGVA